MVDEECRTLRSAIERVCSSPGERGTQRFLRMRGQQYRNFVPSDVTAIVDNPEFDSEERLKEAQSALTFIESGRFTPFLEDVSQFFSKLDRDEQETFTRRNPDVVQWMGAYNRAHELNPYREMQTLAAESMPPDRSKALDPPPFERGELRRSTPVKDMIGRRRSYRNWTPQEFTDLLTGSTLEPDKREVSRGEARELSLWSPEEREGMTFPVRVRKTTVATRLFERVEAGRMAEMCDSAISFFVPLDRDERAMFGRRNPGLVMWMSAFGRMRGMVHGEEMFPGNEEMFPTLREV